MPGDARQHRLGKVHGVADVAVLEEVAQLLGHHHRAVLLGLAGRGAQVRQRHHLRVVLERVAREVADVGVQLAGVERREHGRLVDDAARARS